MKYSPLKVQSKPVPATPSVQKKIDEFFDLKKRVLSATSNPEISDAFRKDVSSVLNKAAITYSVYGCEVEKERVPRDASFICGPSYVSEMYPQPIDSKGCGMFPVLQIDLSWLGALTERKFKSEILQLWWSANDGRESIICIPTSEVDLAAANQLIMSIEAANSVADWIPYEWVCDQSTNCYQITDLKNIGVTLPDFDFLVDEYIGRRSDECDNSEFELLLNELCGSSFYSHKTQPKNRLFNIFGYYKSHLGFPWECESELCFLHIHDWASGMMDANIFMNEDDEEFISNFSFSFGR